MKKPSQACKLTTVLRRRFASKCYSSWLPAVVVLYTDELSLAANSRLRGGLVRPPSSPPLRPQGFGIRTHKRMSRSFELERLRLTLMRACDHRGHRLHPARTSVKPGLDRTGFQLIR